MYFECRINKNALLRIAFFAILPTEFCCPIDFFNVVMLLFICLLFYFFYYKTILM